MSESTALLDYLILYCNLSYPIIVYYITWYYVIFHYTMLYETIPEYIHIIHQMYPVNWPSKPPHVSTSMYFVLAERSKSDLRLRNPPPFNKYNQPITVFTHISMHIYIYIIHLHTYTAIVLCLEWWCCVQISIEYNLISFNNYSIPNITTFTLQIIR